MTEIVTFAAEARGTAGKGPARATRRAGRVPAVIYGNKQPPVLISLDPKPLIREMHRPGFFGKLVDVTVDGKTVRALPRDVQLHPVTDTPLHVDLLRVAADTKVTVAVRVVFEHADLSPGLKRGGVLNIVRHEVDMVCGADHIPEKLTVNLEGFDIGDSIHISAITLPEGTHPAITDRDFTVATIAAPTVPTAEDAAEEAAAAADEPAA